MLNLNYKWQPSWKIHSCNYTAAILNLRTHAKWPPNMITCNCTAWDIPQDARYYPYPHSLLQDPHYLSTVSYFFVLLNSTNVKYKNIKIVLELAKVQPKGQCYYIVLHNYNIGLPKVWSRIKIFKVRTITNFLL